MLITLGRISDGDYGEQSEYSGYIIRILPHAEPRRLATPTK